LLHLSLIANPMDKKIFPSPAIESENVCLEVTTRCTNECTHCFVRAGGAVSHELSLEIARSIIEEGSRYGYRCLHITGGEPFLWPYIFDLLDCAVGAGYQMFLINTNGSLITQHIAMRLSGFGGRITLSISLQGPEDLHDRIRGRGSFQKAIGGIRAALDAGLSVVIFTTIGRSLVALLPGFAEFVFANLAGVKELALIQLIRVSRDTHSLDGELLTPFDFIRMVRSAVLLNLYGYRTIVLENPLAAVAAGLMEMPRLPLALPLYRNGKIVVMADRSITLAHSSRRAYGIYETGMLRSVLMSEDYAAAVSPDVETCPYCRFHGVCGDYGMIRPSEWFRDMEMETPYCKRVLGLIDSNVIV
jgi:MoaA/NifB/PqqE/SkfB family radical SAM enzyme